MAVKAGTIVSLKGDTGPSGLIQVAAPPGPNVGTLGAYAIWNNAGTVYLYGPKTPTGWPQTTDGAGRSTPTSVQLTGVKGDKGDAGTNGTNGLSILTGQGAPASSLGIDGQPGYIDTQAVPNRIYGPKTNGAWPTAYTAINGLVPTTGAPSAAVAVAGSFALDAAAQVLYGPKAADGSWPATTFKGERGADGIQGPPGGAGVTLTQMAASAGPQAALVGSATAANQVITYPGSDVPVTFVPAATGQQFVSFQYLVSSNSSATMQFQLYDQTAGQVMYTTSTIGKGTIATTTLATPIGLTKGNVYVWRASAATAAYGCIVPFYTVPSSSPVATSVMPTAGVFTDTTFTASGTRAYIGGGTAASSPTQYLTLPKVGYLSYLTVSVTGSAQVQVRLLNNSTVIYAMPTTVTAANSPYTTPLYGFQDVPIQANAPLNWVVYGSGTGQVAILPAVTM